MLFSSAVVTYCNILELINDTKEHVNLNNGKGHPMTCLCSHRTEAQVQPQPVLLLGTKREWVIGITSRPLYPWKYPVSVVNEAV